LTIPSPGKTEKKKQKKNRRATGTGCAENCAKLHSIIKVSAVRRQFSGLFAPNLTRSLQSRCDQLAFSDCRRARSRSLRFIVILRLFLTAGAVFESLDFSRYSIYSFFLVRLPGLRQQARSLEDLFMFFECVLQRVVECRNDFVLGSSFVSSCSSTPIFLFPVEISSF
jgi:hypothetical protein